MHPTVVVRRWGVLQRRACPWGCLVGLQIAPLCPNLVFLHLRNMKVMQIPALPLLKHLILEGCVFRPALVASFQGLASLETLHVSGSEGFSGPHGWDLRACTRLRRVCMSHELAMGQANAGQDLCLPPACTVALNLMQSESSREWLVRLGSRLADLRLQCAARKLVSMRSTIMHSPQFSQLRHMTLVMKHRTLHRSEEPPRNLCLASLLGGLPQCVENLHLGAPYMLSEEGMVVVPASLRALRIRGVCDLCACSPIGCCPPSECTQDLCFGLHAGLERLCLVLWGARVGLRCLDAGAQGLQHVNVQARVVDMDDHLAAEVGQRGRVLERCDVFDSD